MDNTLNFGNPELEKESVGRIESKLDYKTNTYAISMGAYYNRFFNYILPYHKLDIKTDTNITSQSFISPVNINQANTLGAFLGFNWNITNSVSNSLNLSYNLGRLSSIDDYMPLIIPFVAKNITAFSFESINVSLATTFNSEQNHISKTFKNEDSSKAFVVFDIYSSYVITDNFKLKFNISNLFNTFYITHTSINNLPSIGREFSIELQWKAN